MDWLSKEDLRDLIEAHQEPSISIFIPTHRAGPQIQQDSIRLKNLADQAEEKLIQAGRRSAEARRLLAPVQDLITDPTFWRNQENGLAVFLSPQTFRTFRLPVEFKEELVVDDRFHLRPLLPLYSGNGRFYLLALSQKGVHLRQGDRYGLREVAVEELPKSLLEALMFDDPQRQLQFHTQTSQLLGKAEGERAAMFHGHGVGTDDAKNNILRFFEILDKELHKFLKEERAPLVLAGVEYLYPIYRQANTYPHLTESGVTGNPELIPGEELHREAWGIVRPYYLKAQEEASAKYWELLQAGRASNDLREVVPAAHQGRVDSLFLGIDFHYWGTFNPDTYEVVVHQEKQSGDRDLLDLACVHTLLKRGTVFPVAPEAIPGQGLLAALFRY